MNILEQIALNQGADGALLAKNLGLTTPLSFTSSSSLATSKTAVASTTTVTKLSNGSPSQLLTKIITLQTYNVSNPNNQIAMHETYEVSPNFVGLVRVSISPLIYVLPFRGTEYGLIFYYPNNYDTQAYNKFYVGYCKKNAAYDIGYQVFKTSVSQAFMDVFKVWLANTPQNTEISNTTTAPLTNTTKSIATELSLNKAYKELRFTFTGSLSKINGNSNGFGVRFTYFPGQAPTTTTTTTTTNLA